MKHDLKTALDERLNTMDFHGGDEVLRRIHASDKKVRLRTAIIIFAILLLLCATALALTLQYSAQYHMRREARSAVSAKYDLTDEMLDLFSVDVQRSGSGWTVRFTPFALNIEAMGVYTVTCAGNGTAAASWSHDDIGLSSLSSGDLGFDAWGAQQLKRALQLRRENTSAWSDAALGAYDGMSLEERAALDAPLLQDKDAGEYINIAPDEKDIPLVQAQAMAQKAVSDKYGIALKVLAEYGIQASFQLIAKDNAREYFFSFQAPHTFIDSYVVRLLSPSGEVTQCKWWVEPENRTLPEGDLKLYVEAAREYAKCGAFELLSARDKAYIAERFLKAGLKVLLPEGDYLVPGKTDISEKEALKNARAVLEKEYGFTADTFSFFEPHFAFVMGSGRRTWQITYSPAKQEDWRWDYNNKLGVYTVTLAAGDGGMMDCAWSLKGIFEDAYNEHTFGAANAYSAKMLPWLKKLKDAQKAILIKYPEDINRDFMSTEDDAAYDELMRQAGFDKEAYCHVIPSAQDIQNGEAVNLSKQALDREYRLNDTMLDTCEKTVNCFMDYSLHDTPIKVWCVTFFNYGQGLDNYTVTLNAATGVIEAIYHDCPEAANG